MEAEIPTSERWDQAVPPPIESIAEWTIGFAEFARALLRGDRVRGQGWPLITVCWGKITEMWRLWRRGWERRGVRVLSDSGVDYCHSTVTFLYESVVASMRKRQTTLGCFDREPWFGLKRYLAEGFLNPLPH